MIIFVLKRLDVNAHFSKVTCSFKEVAFIAPLISIPCRFYTFREVLNLIGALLCIQKQNSKVVVIDDYQDVPTKSESSLLKAVTKNPVSVAIEAGGRDFQHYQGVRIL